MNRILIIILLISGIFMPAALFADHHDQTKPSDPAAKERLETRDANTECAPEDRRCITDQRLDYIEDTVRDVHKSYEDGSAWKTPPYENKTNTKYGYKAAFLLAQTPNFVFKAFTWPIAAVTNQLIEHGVVRTVVDFVSNDDRTLWIYPKIEFGFGSGFGGGIGIKDYDLFKSGLELSTYYLIHININQEVYLALEDDDVVMIAGKPLAFKFWNKWKHHNEDSFYGIGNSSNSNSATYGLDDFQTGGWVGYGVLKNFYVRLHTYYIYDDSRPGKRGEQVNQRFASNQIPAFGKSLHYMDVGIGLIHDTRNNKAAPERGGNQEFTFRHFAELGNGDYDYNEFDVAVTHYFNVWRPRHIFVLRTDWVYQQQLGSMIPFYRLTRLDIDSPLRSYDYGRFRDRARCVFNAEYRFPVWDYIDGQIFVDTGRVFHDWGDFSFKGFKYSAGVGLRLRTDNYFLSRFSIAGGPEGVKVVFKTSQAF